MDLISPTTWADALTAKAERPDLLPIAGGTDVMVDLNFDRTRPAGLLDLTKVPELRDWSVLDGTVELGAGTPYAEVISDLGSLLPGLAMASRTIGSPQIRNRGTVGGNLGSASPAGDAHPPLLATGAEVTIESVRGARRVPIGEFFTGVKRSVLAPDELVRCVLVPVRRGPEQFAKIGTRNAMVIAVASFAVAIDVAGRAVGTGIGSAAPTPRTAPAAAELAASELPWESLDPLAPTLLQLFGELVASAASPIDDVRGTAAYRLHSLAVMARRTLAWAWDEHRAEASR